MDEFQAIVNSNFNVKEWKDAYSKELHLHNMKQKAFNEEFGSLINTFTKLSSRFFTKTKLMEPAIVAESVNINKHFKGYDFQVSLTSGDLVFYNCILEDFNPRGIRRALFINCTFRGTPNIGYRYTEVKPVVSDRAIRGTDVTTAIEAGKLLDFDGIAEAIYRQPIGGKSTLTEQKGIAQIIFFQGV